MKEKLPKPMRDALAREIAPADHPSSDSLAAFMEYALGKSETRSVADHLARCAECRAIVFSASCTAEGPVGEDSLKSRATQAWGAMAHAARATQSKAANGRPKRRRTWRWVWAAPVGAMFLLVGGYFLHQYFAPGRLTLQVASKTAKERLPSPVQPPQNVHPPGVSPASPAPVPTPKSRSEAALGSSAPAKKTPTGSTDSLAMSSEGTSAARREGLPAKAETRKPASEPATIAIGEPLPPAAPSAPRANGFVPSTGGENVQSYTYSSSQLSAQRAAVDALQAFHPGWRVTAQGYLEHRTSEGWTRVLADRPAAFRAVTVVGDNVWAGGSGGALFHSADAGLHWGKVSLPESDTPPAVVSIHFDDQQHGVVSTDSGSRWSTNDGGTTWSRQ